MRRMKRSWPSGLLDAAVRGSGLPNAAVLRPVDTDGSRGKSSRFGACRPLRGAGGAGSGFNFSRSLLSAAADGHVAELSTAGSAGGDGADQPEHRADEHLGGAVACR